MPGVGHRDARRDRPRSAEERAMETSLHRSLKERYATGGDGRPEVADPGIPHRRRGRRGPAGRGPVRAARPAARQAEPAPARPSGPDRQAGGPAAARRAAAAARRARPVRALEPEARGAARRLRRPHRRGPGLPALRTSRSRSSA